ncbi:hypothetical protein RN70_00345 [Staphylococcus schleiferi]|uniref:WYL domain-containing protein n=3 Tax=Staphylococcus pseudintermedius TaxID=283734 RepID=A0A317YRB4_STAPS|nr:MULTISPECIES: hypothetical protein [Staphylococcus]AKS72487.1 hypothetical protein RN70_00345 [Staphylococcus schleiferi]MDU5817210.1 hypothetical protein [Staphylococcus sp.]OLF32541.1 hypothetical protein BSZ10_02745 [Staphylococcus aureus]ANQ80602.1 hypothetical protein A9I66_00320 [Staphylococcus pseudintermedius]EGQ1633257.1 hypothetical protein [Staphylococcus pseudintermedius]
MEKEKRLLYFFLLMINGEKINRSELIRKTMKTSRTIRRDMDSINRFFTDPELPWYDSNTQIKLIGKNDNAYYQIENNSFNYDSYATLGLLLSIKSLTPKLHRNVYNLFIQLISNGRAEDVATLKSILNHFSIREKAYDDIFPGQELMMLQKALIREKMVGFKQKSTKKSFFATPHSLMYMNYDYWFTYELGNEFYDVKVRDLSDVYIDENYSKKKSEANELVKVRVHKNISNELFQLYDVQYQRPLNEEEAKFVDKECDWLIFEIACTKLDAFYIAYQKAPHAQILAPQTYVDSFLERMLEIFNQYDMTT